MLKLCVLLLPALGCAVPASSLPAPAAPGAQARAPLRFAVSFPAQPAPLDGRLLVFISTDGSDEPRLQTSDHDSTAQVFGLDVEGLAAGGTVTVGEEADGYPLRAPAALPEGDYFVQPLFHVYQTFHRGDGKVVKLPADRGEGQQMNEAPGNLFAAPQRLHLAPGGLVRLALDRVLPPLSAPKDSKYVRHVRLKSERLTAFWGQPTYLGAVLLLPEGFDTHPQARYPLAIAHGHFERTLTWRETPPDAALPPVDLAGLARDCPNGHEGAVCKQHGYERLEQEQAYALFKRWTGPGFPRAIEVHLQHATPFFDDSYAVNSENNGPYGDAITYELIPYLEKEYRGLGKWARGLTGGSTGGWEALAAQILYPDEYNGAIANCPDPIDFRSYGTIDLYADDNAYLSRGPFRSTPRASERDQLGRLRATIEQSNQREAALGSRSRSGEQWDAWEAVFSPVGADGYPKRIWDKRTGEIDRQVAAYWREHYDLGERLRRDWATLGPKLRGKLTINAGLADNYYLDAAVWQVEQILKSAQPPSDAQIAYGPHQEHCWSGDGSAINAVSRLTTTQRFLPRLAEHWTRTAPPGADVSSWKY